MIKKETDFQSPLHELNLAKLGCRSALESAYHNSQVSETFYHFITAASAQLPDSILFRKEGPKGLIQLKGNDKLSPKETCYYFLPKSFEIYVFNQEGYRPTSRIYLPGDDNFVGMLAARRKGLPFQPFFDQKTGLGNFKQIQEITAAIGTHMEKRPSLNKKLSFRYRELTAWVQACQETQDDILNKHIREVQWLIADLRDVIMESSECRRLPSVIYGIKNRYDLHDPNEYVFSPRELKLKSVSRSVRKHPLFKYRKPDFSKLEDAPITCWLGAIDDITKALLTALPQRRFINLRSSI